MFSFRTYWIDLINNKLRNDSYRVDRIITLLLKYIVCMLYGSKLTICNTYKENELNVRTKNSDIEITNYVYIWTTKRNIYLWSFINDYILFNVERIFFFFHPRKLYIQSIPIIIIVKYNSIISKLATTYWYTRFDVDVSGEIVHQNYFIL
jgi:hypothetical protein